MAKALVLFVALLMALATPLAAQPVPIACKCTLLNNTWPANNTAFIGSANSTGACSIVIIGSSSYCQLTGTITLVYTPASGFVLTGAQWGLPSTVFWPPRGQSTFTHSGVVPCGQGSQASYIAMYGYIGSAYHTMTAQRQWACDPD